MKKSNKKWIFAFYVMEAILLIFYLVMTFIFIGGLDKIEDETLKLTIQAGFTIPMITIIFIVVLVTIQYEKEKLKEKKEDLKNVSK